MKTIPSLSLGKCANACLIKLALLMLLAGSSIPAKAQYFPAVPPAPVVMRQTPVTVSYNQPQKTLVIDVSQYDPDQVLKKMTINLKEAVRSASFTIYALSQKPPEVLDPKESPLYYFTVRVERALLEKADKVTMRFTVSKLVIDERKMTIETIALNRFYEGQWQQLPTKLVEKGQTTILFEAESQGLSHFAVTGTIQASLFPTMPGSLIISSVVVVFIFVFIYGIRHQWWV